MSEIRRRKVRTLRSRTGLLRYAFNNTSQGGEDGIIERIFRLLPPPPPQYASSEDDDCDDDHDDHDEDNDDEDRDGKNVTDDDDDDDDGNDDDKNACRRVRSSAKEIDEAGRNREDERKWDEEAVHHLPRQQRRRRRRHRPYYCVDVGAWDGRHLSNTYSLLVPSSTSTPAATTSPSIEDGRPAAAATADGDDDNDVVDDNDSFFISKKIQPQDDNLPFRQGRRRSPLPKTNTSKPESSPHRSRREQIWKGILIEADKDRFEQLVALHEPLGNICIHETVSCMSSGTSNQSLTSILRRHCHFPSVYKTKDGKKGRGGEKRGKPEKHCLPRDFDFLSVDVDGVDYWLIHQILTDECIPPFNARSGRDDKEKKIRGNIDIGSSGGRNSNIANDERSEQEARGKRNVFDRTPTTTTTTLTTSYYRPRVICVEFNPTIPIDVIYIQERSDLIRHGSSIAALYELLSERHGYRLVETTTYNAFFVDGYLYDAYMRRDVPETTLEVLFESNMLTSLYQLYDGTIKISGCRKMLWHRIPIDEEKLQQIPIKGGKMCGAKGYGGGGVMERTFPFAPEGKGKGGGRPETCGNAVGGDGKKIKDDKGRRQRAKNGINRSLDRGGGGGDDVGDNGDGAPVGRVDHNDDDAAGKHGDDGDDDDDDTIRNLAVDMSPYCCSLPVPRAAANTDEDDYDDDDVKDKKAEKEERMERCSLALIDQLRTNGGFALVRGTKMRPESCSDALRASKSFLIDADECVRKSCLSKIDRARRGYSPPYTENFASLLGVVGPNDCVRKFRVGRSPPPPSSLSLVAIEGEDGEAMKDGSKPLLVDDNGSGGGTFHPATVAATATATTASKAKTTSSPLLRPNIWPDPNVWRGRDGDGDMDKGEPAPPSSSSPSSLTTATYDPAAYFRRSIESYYEESARVAHRVLDAICDGLIRTRPDLRPSLSVLFSKERKKKTMTMMMEEAIKKKGEGGSKEGGEEDNATATADRADDTSILTLLGYHEGIARRGGGGRRRRNKRNKKEGTDVGGKGGGEYAAHPLVAAHTDVGVITFLFFDAGDCAVLQRAATSASGGSGNGNDGGIDKDDGDQSDEWVDVTLPRHIGDDPVFVVNVGDCLSELCRGALPSALHRVVSRGLTNNDGSGRRRFGPRTCLALFVGLDPDAALVLPSSSLSSDNGDDDRGVDDDGGGRSGERFVNITYEEWRRKRIARAAKVMKEGRR